MKNENINVGMVRMVDNYVPFIEIGYTDKSGKECSGMIMLDTGSNSNLLTIEVAESIDLQNLYDDKKMKIQGMSGSVTESNNVKFSFTICGTQIEEPFCISPELHEKSFGYLPIIGILGNEFMQRHRLVIDYSDGTCHTSEVNPSNLSIADCDFFFPMEIGLKVYGLPVLAMMQNDKEIVTLADTGATNNAIANQTITDNGFKHKYLEEGDVMIGLGGKVEVKDVVVNFNLVTLKEDNDIKEVNHQDLFKSLPHYLIPPFTRGDNQYPPLEALVSSEFMAKQGWALDFGAKIIYKRKKALKEAV